MDVRSSRPVRRCVERARRFRDEGGQSLVEYGLILILLAVVVVFVLSIIGKQDNNLFSNISNGLNH